MVDYPSTKEEAYGLSMFGKNINCYYEVYQVQENPDGTAPGDLKEASQVNPSEDESEQEAYAKFEKQHKSIIEAISNCAPDAPLRNMAHFRVPYCDVEEVELKMNEEGEQATNVLSAEQSFVKTFLQDYLELYGAFQMNFEKFTEKIQIHQLMPDKLVMDEIRRLRSAHDQFKMWEADQWATHDELKN